MNLLFVFADQMHAFALGCMGTSDIHTPNLDRLASQGTLFRHAYSNAPVCSPFRVCLFSGLYGSQINGLRNRALIPEHLPTLPQRLNEGGYRTSYVGKWHIGDSGNKPIPENLRAGFADFIGYQCYNDFLDEVCFYDEAGTEHRYDGHRTDVTTDVALERLRGLAGNPFALFVSYQNPHYPVQPSPEYEAMYVGKTIARRPNSRDVEPYTKTFSPPSPQPFERDPNFRKYGGNLDEYLRLYYAMVTQLDANVGRLLAELERFGLADDTAVVFTSDHGDMQGSHGLTNKAYAWEESAGIPLVIRVPGGRPGSVCDGLVTGIDFLPTALEWAGLPPEPTSEGRSIAAAARGDEQALDGPVFSEMERWCMVRRGSYKLVADGDAVTPADLYNLDDDPYEMDNLVARADLKDVRESLLADLVAWRRHTREAAHEVKQPWM